MVMVGIIFAVTVVASLFYSNYKRNEIILEKIRKEFGEKPENFNKEFDMSLVTEYYNARKITEDDGESIDELTWNDLDMDFVFKRINYTSTTFGETYLYYKLREVSYDKDKWNTNEKLINKLMENDSLRDSIKLELFKLGKIKDKKFIDFIYNPKFNRIRDYYKYVLLSLGFTLSIISIFFFENLSVGLVTLFICTNILFYQSAKAYLEDNLNTMIYLLNSIRLCQKLSKIKDDDFRKIREKLQDTLKNFKNYKKVKQLSMFLSKNSEGIISDLSIVGYYIKMFFMLDVISYQNIVKILEENKKYLYLIYDLVGELDFLVSIAYYRKSLDLYSNPEFVEDDVMVLQDVYHPLVDNAVKNSLTIDKNIIFTGSNASGKSTFIKAVALNCIMAQSLNTVLCSKYKCRISKVVTSMAIRDNISNGDSYFIAEIKSLKRLLDSLNGEVPVLAVIDEILKGTNTIERISASASILKYARGLDGRVLVATHDIELTEMIETGYENYHFTETITDNEVLFDYKLRKGPSTTRNAIKLLEVMDFKDIVVEDANSIYRSFMKNRKWSKI